MSAFGDAHAEISSSTDYEYKACCRSATDILSNSCPGDAVPLHLSANTDAHAEKSTESNFMVDVCLGASAGSISCVYRTANCLADEACLATISADTDAHVGDCATQPFANKICCKLRLKMNERLISYIIRNIGLGHHPEKIKLVLLNAGWNVEAVEAHLKHALGLKPKKSFADSIKRELASNSEKYFIIGLIAVFVIVVSFMGLNYFFDFNIKEREFTSVKIVQDYNSGIELFNMALIKNNEFICDEITDDSLKKECKSSFMHNKSVCDEQCQDKKMLNKAIIHNNESLCKDIINESIQN